MKWELPLDVEIEGKTFKIRNKCDYKVVLDVISVFNDAELTQEEQLRCALFIFYEDLSGCADVHAAIREMMKIIGSGTEEEDKPSENNKPPLMNWEHDFLQIVPPINRVLGYSVRDPKNYTHWNDFVGAYMEIGECHFSTIVSIREKLQKRKPLEKWEQEFYRENKRIVDLPCTNMTEDELEWLESD